MWGFAGIRSPPAEDPARGAYLLGETRLAGPGGKDRAFGLFGRVGLADGGPVRAYAGSGATVSGALHGPDDELGLGLALAWPAENFPHGSGETARADPEMVVELSYRVNVAGWLFVQPGVQYVSNPVFATARDRAIVLTTRIGVLH